MTLIPGTETILIIDDDHLVLSLAHRMLRSGGYGVLTATSGGEAIALFKNWPNIEVHLLLVDLVMPGMCGGETVEQIHKLRPGLPVLFFSAYSELELLRPRYARNIPFLRKPFTSFQLTTKVRQILDGAYAMVAFLASEK